eukprot:CAMPEP_0118662366 /NCGR_PEP_ID=MMETSP0785-20121206/16793_1 /TAXON_ID=91992 /ORGANISM="Bolidomonas pacifica, Strain CCMP 1866" /LENGTH=72 /DNA_ID=CAMNT_0006555905 /DNA_START=96 /DNA_END=311 /DNA_ORIENTATION=-
MSSFITRLREFQAAHRRFVKKVHNTRIPLPPWGVTVMKFVYFSIPCFLGYQSYLYSQSQSNLKWAARKADLE